MNGTYTVEQKGDEAGFPGWWTVLRNGNPIHHFEDAGAARAWVVKASFAAYLECLNTLTLRSKTELEIMRSNIDAVLTERTAMQGFGQPNASEATRPDTR